MFRNPFFISIIVLICSTSFLIAQTDWTFLDTKKIKASQFIASNPEFDGKNTIIIVLDTGVDMGTSGLTTLPDGGAKVIDAQDFSKEGDYEYARAKRGRENKEHFLEDSFGFRLYGFDKLSVQPADSVLYIGVIEEENFKNSVIPDINNNNKYQEEFGFVVMKSKNEWLVIIDLDGDGNLDDEELMRNYKDSLEWFQFRGRDTQNDRNLAAFALNIFPDERRINLHYDGSSHGTHVAGIAAGYKINGQDGLNGIAPGAKIISLKIGDGRFSGGATITGSMQKAYEYGIDFAKSYEGPVVFTMSYGIGSEIEGQADMEYILDDLLAENDDLLFCTSAGNEGPGISTVGLPASAKRILSVGALNSRESARDVYGADLERDKIFVFSSRGGEVNKPDILAPGSASSTVPPFSSRENKWGTSMACPQAAGAVALIMSAASQQNPPLAINGALVKKAIKNSANFLEDYLNLDQGNGVIDVPKAFEFYKKYISQNEHKSLVGYDISTISPIYKSESGPAAYWRFGGYVPDEEHKQRFYINPVLPKTMNADERYNFYRAYNLETSHSWIKLNNSSTYIKGEKPATVDVYYDRDKMREPGVYNGIVSAFRKGGLFSGNSEERKEFELMCTVIIPQKFNEQNNYIWQSPEISIAKGDVKRFLFEVPLGASSASIRLGKVESKYANLWAYLFDPAGHESEHRLNLNNEKASAHIIRLDDEELDPGIWELDLYADFRNEKTSYAELKIAFSGLDIYPSEISDVRIKNGQSPRGSFDVTNHYNHLYESRVSGKIMGLQRMRYLEESTDLYEYSFKVDDNIERVDFELEMDAETFNFFTDFAINIVDYSDNVLNSDGLSYKKKSISFIPPSRGNYILQLVPGFAAREPKPWSARLKESFYFFKKTDIVSGMYDFYPKVKKEVEFGINGQVPVAPDGFHLFGEIWIDDTSIHKYRVSVPVKLYTGMND